MPPQDKTAGSPVKLAVKIGEVAPVTEQTFVQETMRSLRGMVGTRISLGAQGRSHEDSIIETLSGLVSGRISTHHDCALAIMRLKKHAELGNTSNVLRSLEAIQDRSRSLESGAEATRRQHDAEMQQKELEIARLIKSNDKLLAEKAEWARSKQAQAAKDLKFEQMGAELERTKLALDKAQKDGPELVKLRGEFDDLNRRFLALQRTTGKGEADSIRELQQQVATSAARIAQLERLVADGEVAKKDLEVRLLDAQTQLGVANKAKEDSIARLKTSEDELRAAKKQNGELEVSVADLRGRLAAKPAVAVAAPTPVVPAVVNPDISEQLDRMEEKLQDFDKISAQLEALKLQLAEAQQKLLEAQGESERALLEERQKLQLALEKCAVDKDAAQAALNEQFAAIVAALKEAAANRESGGSGRSEPVVVKATTTVATQTEIKKEDKAKAMAVSESSDAATNTKVILKKSVVGTDASEPPITDDPIDFEAMLTAVAATMFPSKEAASAAATNGQKNQVFKSFVRGLSEALNDAGGREDSTSRKAFDAMGAQIAALDPEKKDFIASLNSDEGFRNQFLTWADKKAQEIKASSATYNEGYDHSEFEPLYEKYNQSPTSSPAKPIISWQVSRTELDLQNIRGKIS